MHTLNFNRVFTDFNPARKCAGPTECEPSVGRIGSIAVRRRKCWIAACAPERNGVGGGESQKLSAGSLFSRSQTYALLKQQMVVAAKSEDYEEAARIRDSLRTFEDYGEAVSPLKNCRTARIP